MEHGEKLQIDAGADAGPVGDRLEVVSDLLIEGVASAPQGAGDPVDRIPDLPATPPLSQLGDL